MGNGKDKEFLSFISGKREWELPPSILITRNPNWSQRSSIGTGCVKRRCNNPDFFFITVIFIYRFHRNFYQNFSRDSSIRGGPKLSMNSYYISNFISQSDPIILDLNSTHHHQHNTSYSITLTMHNSIVTSYKLYLA